jgi:erythrocyte band 7 integral membrane protein
LGQTGFNNKGNLQVLTKDSVTVSVDAVVYYRVSNATISVANVENAHHSTRYKETE